MKVRVLAPGLLLSGDFTHRPRAEKQETLRAYGVSTVVRLVNGRDDDLEACGVTAINMPISDGLKVDERLPALASELAAQIREDRGVLVHCRAGRNRSALLAGLILHELYGWDGPRIVEHLREQRQNALANEAFTGYLSNLKGRR